MLGEQAALYASRISPARGTSRGGEILHDSDRWRRRTAQRDIARQADGDRSLHYYLDQLASLDTSTSTFADLARPKAARRRFRLPILSCVSGFASFIRIPVLIAQVVRSAPSTQLIQPELEGILGSVTIACVGSPAVALTRRKRLDL